MRKRSSEAQRMLDELDAELAANPAAAGRTLGWSATERAILCMAADSVDRRAELAAAYTQATEIKDKVRLSREIRLQEATTLRMLCKISTAAPAPETLRTVKARAAARARWDRDAR